MKIKFLGATQVVTGSKFLLEHEGKRVLVDCGLFQGYKHFREKNWERFPVDPASLSAIALTHAHIDHSGYLPVLVKQGFKGKIFATQASYDLCKVLLKDSAHLQEEDADRANRYHYSKHHPALPLYTKEDVEMTLKQFEIVHWDQAYTLNTNCHFSWHRAGHILGAGMIKVEFDKKILLFSGDLGRPHDPIMFPPAIMQFADYIVLDSTYGNRLHPETDPKMEMASIINTTIKRGGTVLIPAFAVGRSQTMLYHLHALKKENLIPNIPIFFDSPMAIHATEVFQKHDHEHDLSKKQVADICSIATYVSTPDESREIDSQPMPKVILSASGMATGGRVLHHLKALLPDPENTVLFTGFQLPGTRGARLVNGETEIKIHGQYFPVRAEIKNLENMSAHSDYNETLDWLSKLRKPPLKIFLVHGELDAINGMKANIENTFGWSCEIPDYLETKEL